MAMNEKRPARGAARRRLWQAIGLLLVPAVLLAIIAVPAHLFAGRLPIVSADRYVRVAPVQGANGSAGFWVLLWLAGLGAFALLRGKECRVFRVFWEYALPAAYLLGGFLAGGAVVDAVNNLDAAGIQPPDRLGWQAGVPPMVGALLCGAIGAAIGRAVVGAERDPLQARGRVRAVWVSEVRAGRDGWLLQAAWAAPWVLLTAWGSGLGAGLTVVAFLLAVSLWFQTARISITPAGVRVRLGLFGLFGWRLPMERIVSVDVVPVSAWWPPRWLPDVVLRSGPALALGTTAGSTRVIAVPEAAEAAAVLRGWLRGPLPGGASVGVGRQA
jgi:hypothetical protein